MLPSVNLPEIILEHPQNITYGDYASNISLKLARPLGMNPLVIAKEIIAHIEPSPEVERVSVAPPGFINFALKNGWFTNQVQDILEAGTNFGSINYGQNAKVQIEFVSVNPTGPLHVGHGRGAILGSTLANVLTLAGYNVEKEYYINDAGAQISAFYLSLYIRYKQAFNINVDMPENGYMGSYMIDLAKEIIAEQGDIFLNMPEDQAVQQLGKIGLVRMIRRVLKKT